MHTSGCSISGGLTLKLARMAKLWDPLRCGAQGGTPVGMSESIIPATPYAYSLSRPGAVYPVSNGATASPMASTGTPPPPLKSSFVAWITTLL